MCTALHDRISARQWSDNQLMKREKETISTGLAISVDPGLMAGIVARHRLENQTPAPTKYLLLERARWPAWAMPPGALIGPL